MLTAASPAARRRGRTWLRLPLLTLIALSAAPAASAAPRIGGPAPPLIARELDGKVFDLARLRGQVVMVSFWATWCSPCRGEMPVLDAFYRRYRRRGLALIALSIDQPLNAARVRREMRPFSYPAALASTARVNGFGEPLAVPMTYVVDASGRIRLRLVGAQTPGDLRARLRREVLPLLSAARRP